MSRHFNLVPNKFGVRTGFAVVAAAVLVLSAGCSKSSTDTTSTARTSTAPSGNGQAAGCPAGAYKDPHGIYCVVVPQGYKPPASTRQTDYKYTDQFETDDGFSFSIEYWSADENGGKLEDMKDQWLKDGPDDGLTPVAKADLPGGGLYQSFHSDKFNEDSMRSVIKSGNKVITCDAEYNVGVKLQPADACKTLVGTNG